MFEEGGAAPFHRPFPNSVGHSYLINGDGGYGLLAAYIGGPAAQAHWLGPKVGDHLAPFLYSSREPSELSQWLCYDDSTINIFMVIIIIIILYSLSLRPTEVLP